MAPRTHWPSSLSEMVQSRFHERTYFKNMSDKGTKRDKEGYFDIALWPPHPHMHTLEHIHTCHTDKHNVKSCQF